MTWFNGIASIVTVVSFCCYLYERSERRKLETFMNGWLHGVKPLIESHALGADPWASLLTQINDALERLQSPAP
jgi:hypothetical protein